MLRFSTAAVAVVLVAVVLGQAETSFQIRTAATADDFHRRVDAVTKSAAAEWRLAALRAEIQNQPHALSTPEDAADWIRGDIETRFRSSTLMPIRTVLADVAKGLRLRYLQDFSLTLGNLDGQLAAVYGPLSSDNVFNSIKMQERDRAGAALSEGVFSYLSAFRDLAKTANVASVGVVVAYGYRDFAGRDSTPEGEAVAIVMPAAIVAAYLDRQASVDEVAGKSRVTLCHLLDCQVVRPRLP